MIKFSIITVCLNAGNDLIETVNNLLNQTYENYEVIVKDGFSTDGSIERLPQNERINFMQCKDKNVYDAMNQAINIATGDFCLFINAGDGLYETTTLKQISMFISENIGDFYYGKSYTMSSKIINYGPANINKFFCYRTTLCHQAIAIRTEFLKKRGFDISYRISADREWMIYAFVIANIKFIRMPIMVSKYKGGGLSYGNKVAHAIQRESKRMNETHFTMFEIFKYNLMLTITLPGLRRRISSSPKFKRAYYKFKYNFFNK